MRHPEIHRTHRVGWLRAAVLGANDGIVSTASLMLGVAAAEASRESVLTAGIAGLVAGVIPSVSATSLVFLALLGAIAARAGGAGPLLGAVRVTVWGALAMGLTTLVGRWFGSFV